MTNAEKRYRLDEVQRIADSVLVRLAIGTEEQGFDDEEEHKQLEENKKLVKHLIAKARALGRDYSSVIR